MGYWGVSVLLSIHSPSVQLADEHGVKFMETSAKSGLNVETVSNVHTTL